MGNKLMTSITIYKTMVFVFILSFALGGYVLESLGIRYVSEGGNPLFKIHVVTYILIFSVMSLTLKKGVTKPLANLESSQSSWLVSMLCIVLVIIYGLVRFGTSGMAYLVDTMVAPLLAIYLQSQLNYQQKNKLLKLLAYLLFLNSLIAIFEFAVGKTFVFVEFKNFSHFRSTALLTHPLNNALITAALAPLLMNYTRVPYLIYLAVSTLALFAYGGRGATGVFLLGMFFLLSVNTPSFIIKGIRISKMRFAVIQALGFIVTIFTMLLVILTPLGARILSKLHVDPSAQARFDVFIILEQLSLAEWLLGASASIMENIKFYIGVNIIENYVVGWILSFGLFATILLLIACFKIPIHLIFKSGVQLKVAFLVLLGASVTNNALTTKTPVLLLFFSCLYLAYASKRERNDNKNSVT